MGDGGPATAAQIGSIQGIAADRWGNLYLSDTDHHRVREPAPRALAAMAVRLPAPSLIYPTGLPWIWPATSTSPT
jgi:hypothetical protein